MSSKSPSMFFLTVSRYKDYSCLEKDICLTVCQYFLRYCNPTSCANKITDSKICLVIPDDIVEKVLGVVPHRVEVVLQVSPRVLYHTSHHVLR
jgi:hypothetical protein